MSPIEDHALLGDGETVALVDRTGAIDWLCWPRVDSEAVFCGLLGTEDHGFWRIAAVDGQARVSRGYREGTLVLETRFETAEGCVEVVDALPVGTRDRHLVRVVRGLRGRLRVRSELAIRLAYGLTIPWVTNVGGVLCATGGENRLVLRGPVKHEGRDFRSCAEFDVAAGDEVAFDLAHGMSYEAMPAAIDACRELEATTRHWRDWIAKARIEGPHADIARRSLLTLKALSNSRTGGIVAAATTSLPEQPGGTRNWDYRYCWVRDSTLTLLALLQTGYEDEARRWRDWLLRACAGAPEGMQIMYGVRGERLLPEWEADWLPGHGGARPVRIGNLASRQRQLDIFGEVADVMFQSVVFGQAPDEEGLQRGLAVLRHVARIWREPDFGMWEVRGEPRHFTHSKVMAWVAVDRFIRLVEQLRADSVDLQPWRALRAEMHDWICANCTDPQGGAHFVQHAGGSGVDAALLMLPLVGFLPAHDPRMVATVAAIEKRLVHDGLVCRYVTDPRLDGLPPGEGTFLACSFWLVDNLVLQGRLDEARTLYERLLGLCNDVGLLSEEYDPLGKRMLGNFPQAFSHVGIVNSALNLVRATGPAKQRAEKGEAPTRQAGPR